MLGLLLMAGAATMPAQAQDLSRLQSILAATPEGGWAKVSIGNLGSAFPTGLDAVPSAYGASYQIVPAWSSTVWDPVNDQLLLWGGGHANYGGNEMYRWDAGTGNWTRGSLPSALVTSDSWLPVVGNGAPESAHTYAGNAWLPLNQMFVTFGGASYPNGSGLYDTSHNPTGPWVWDPSKANADQVGGASGTGWDPTRSGGNMWTNLAPNSSGTAPQSFIHVTSATRVENGRDVVYLTADSSASGFATLYRYQVGSVASGGSDQWSVVGKMSGDAAAGFTYQGAAAIDSAHNLFVRTGSVDPNLWDNIPSTDDAFIVWDLNKSALGGANLSQAVRLVDGSGKTIEFDSYHSGIDFDSATGQFILWSSTNKGQVYVTKAQYDANGNLLSTWLATAVNSTTAAQPTLTANNGVLGKWEYVPALNAFVAVEEYNSATADAAVWVYKPLSVAAVPETSTTLMLAVGLVTLLLWRRRQGGRA